MCDSSSASRGQPRAAAICAFAERRNAERRRPVHQRLQPPPRLPGLAGIVARHGRQQLRVEPLPVAAGPPPRRVSGPPSAAIASTSASAPPMSSCSSRAKNRPTRAVRKDGSAASTSPYAVAASSGPPEREQGVRLRVPDVRRNRVAVLSERGDGLGRRGPPPAIAQGDHAVAPQPQQEPGIGRRRGRGVGKEGVDPRDRLVSVFEPERRIAHFGRGHEGSRLRGLDPEVTRP